MPFPTLVVSNLTPAGLQRHVHGVNIERFIGSRKSEHVMPLKNNPQRVATASGDIVFAANIQEAEQRLKQYEFAAAVLAWDQRALETARSIGAKSVPLCVFADSKSQVPADAEALIVDGFDHVVPSLQVLLRN
jgi:hypothetical protein